MNHLTWPASLTGLMTTAVIFGADMFFLTVGRPALRLAFARDARILNGAFNPRDGPPPATQHAVPHVIETTTCINY